MATKKKKKKKKTKSRKLFRCRSFLNPPSDGGIAIISAHVTTTEREDTTNVDASLLISDCSNSILLDFDVWTSSQDSQVMAERRKKIKVLRTEVNAFLDAVEEGYAALEAHQKRTAKKKKK